MIPKYQHNGVGPLKCEQCDKTFTRPDRLRDHARTHTGEKPYDCDVCGKRFTRSDNLQAHQIIHTGVKPFECKQCNKSFKRLDTLKVHARAHSGEKPYGCDACGKYFKTSRNLQAHQIIHTGAKPFKCRYCEKCFRHARNLKSHEHVHVGAKHARAKPFACETCGKSFDKMHCLTDHLRVHTGEKPFKCDECGKCFKQQSQLSAHRRTHTAEKPYACPECAKTFQTVPLLTRHQRTHTGEKPCQCNVCGTAFAWKEQLIAHEMTCADNFPCGVDGCQQEFGDPYELEDHKVKAHRARRRLKCSFCLIRFSCGRGLKEHERQVHYGEFKHRCSCSLGFQSSAHLTRHQEKCDGVAKTTYMSRLLKLVAEKDRRFEDDFEIERTEDGDEEIVGKSRSTVLKARSNRPDKCQNEYAVKRIEVLKDEPAEMRQATAKALTEALIAKQRCHHKNTASAEAVYYDGNNVYIVSELIRPGSLEKVVLELDKKGKVIEEAHVASIMHDIAEALEFLRGEGIMHRDVKTANILIDLEAVAMLTDYGQSAIDGPVKLSCVGTRGFWAPEAARFLDEAQTHAVDIRLLGIVAAECLAQETVPTFTFDNAPEAVPVWLKRRLAHNNKPPPSDDFIDFIVKCLQKEPSKRPTAVQLLAHPLVRKATTMSRQSLKELIACIL